MDLQLTGKTALVLAASKGLGKACATALAAEGANVVIGARNPGHPQRRRKRDPTPSAKAACSPYPSMCCSPQDAEKIVAAAVSKFGRLDILVNNAGGPPFGKFESFDESAWHSAFELTLLSAVRFCRLAIPHLRKSGSGRIINITSLTVLTYLPQFRPLHQPADGRGRHGQNAV